MVLPRSADDPDTIERVCLKWKQFSCFYRDLILKTSCAAPRNSTISVGNVRINFHLVNRDIPNGWRCCGRSPSIIHFEISSAITGAIAHPWPHHPVAYQTLLKVCSQKKPQTLACKLCALSQPVKTNISITLHWDLCGLNNLLLQLFTYRIREIL